MFHFLGFSIGMKRSSKTGKMYPLTEPSKEALKHIRSEIKRLTTERFSATPTDVVIRIVNEAARGWVGYFRFGNCTKANVTEVLLGIQDAYLPAPETPLPQFRVQGISGQVLL